MEKVTVIAGDVRGLGDIVSSKSASDFTGVDASITEGTDSGLGKVFNLSGSVTPESITLTGDKAIMQVGDTLTLDGGVFSSFGHPVVGDVVYFFMDFDHFIDSANSDRTSEYTPMLCEGGTNPSMSYSSGTYTVSGGSKTAMLVLEDIGKLNKCNIKCKVKPSGTSFSGAIGLAFATSVGNAWGVVGYSNGQVNICEYRNNTWVTGSQRYHTGSVDSNGVMTINAVKNGSSVTLNCGDTDTSITLPSSECYIGLMFGTGTNYYKGINIHEVE